MAGGGHHSHPSSNSSRWYRPMYGFHPHMPAAKHRYLAKAIGATMWFFIFYRAKQDGPALIGLRHPWDGHGHGHGQHEDHHGESEH